MITFNFAPTLLKRENQADELEFTVYLDDDEAALTIALRNLAGSNNFEHYIAEQWMRLCADEMTILLSTCRSRLLIYFGDARLRFTFVRPSSSTVNNNERVNIEEKLRLFSVNCALVTDSAAEISALDFFATGDAYEYLSLGRLAQELLNDCYTAPVYSAVMMYINLAFRQGCASDYRLDV